MDDKLKKHIQCLIENVGLNATRHKDQKLAIKEAKEVMEEIVKNCSIPDVSQQSELFKSFLEKVVEETEVGDLTWQTRDEAKEILKLFNCG